MLQHGTGNFLLLTFFTGFHEKPHFCGETILWEDFRWYIKYITYVNTIFPSCPWLWYQVYNKVYFTRAVTSFSKSALSMCIDFYVLTQPSTVYRWKVKVKQKKHILSGFGCVSECLVTPIDKAVLTKVYVCLRQLVICLWKKGTKSQLNIAGTCWCASALSYRVWVMRLRGG